MYRYCNVYSVTMSRGKFPDSGSLTPVPRLCSIPSTVVWGRNAKERDFEPPGIDRLQGETFRRSKEGEAFRNQLPRGNPDEVVATERFRHYRQIEAKEESALSRTGDLRVYEGPQNTSSVSSPARRWKTLGKNRGTCKAPSKLARDNKGRPSGRKGKTAKRTPPKSSRNQLIL